MKEIAKKIYIAVNVLNKLLSRATSESVQVDIDILDVRTMDENVAHQSLQVKCFKFLEGVEQ